jgi:hypothetical protein
VDKKGSYDIKSGSFDDMFEILRDLENMELKVEMNESSMHK